MKDGAPRPTLLILGDLAGADAGLRAVLEEQADCLLAPDPEAAWPLMAEHFVQVVLWCGGSATGRGGVLETLRARWPETLVIALGAEPDADEPALSQVLPLDADPAHVLTATRAALRQFDLARENERLALEMRCLTGLNGARAQAPRRTSDLGFEGILRSPGSPMGAVVTAARQFASFDVPVLLTGEPGTGKAQMARAIHDGSLRSGDPFVRLDARGLSAEALALALFGRRKPANGTPAISRVGLARRAAQGTLYLSGLDALPAPLQDRLLRLVRDGEFVTEGSTEAEPSRVRLITALDGDPRDAVAAGRLDPALYYALSVAELSLPPLRSRPDDIAMLASRAVDDAAQTHGKRCHGVSEAALDFLAAYDWPGNLPELHNEMTRMLIQSSDAVLGPDVISRRILQSRPIGSEPSEASEIMAAEGPLKERIEAFEARILRETLTRLRWNKSRSAAELGLSRVGLRAKLERYGIARPKSPKQEA